MLKQNHKKSVAIITISALFLSIAASFILFHTPDKVSAAWYSTGGTWNFRQQITIDHTKVSNTDQTDFPVLIRITDASNPVFANAQADGDDILFTSSDETTKLSHEIEKFDTATHELIVWVKIPTLSASADTVIYMYYGNESASSQQNRTDVWSNGFLGVWHSQNATSTTIADSTSSNITGNKQAAGQPAEIAGKIGFGQDYDGTDDKVNFGDVNAIDGLTALTMTAWIKTDLTNSDDEVFSKATTHATNQPLLVWRDDQVGAGTQEGNADALSVMIYDGDTMAWSSSPTNSMNDTNWHLVGFTFAANVAAGLKPYVDGANSTNASTANVNMIRSTVNNFVVGAPAPDYSGTTALDGLIDEIQVSSTVRSADWMATEYANQSDPGSFFALGDEVVGDSEAPANPTLISGRDTEGGESALASNNFYNYATPYFSWPAVDAEGGAADTGGVNVSGVAGYYSYFGTSCGDQGANPKMSRGVLSDTGDGLHFSSDTNISVPDLSTNEGTYCLRIKTADNAGNVSAVSEVFIYKYDSSDPSPPTFIAVNPAGYSSTNSFDFSWPVALDTINSYSSNIYGYEYKRGGDSGDDWTSTTATKVEDLEAYQEGTNIFIIRSKDNAGNYSDSIQTTYYYSASPPTKPTALTASPDLSDENSFAFSWTAPEHSRPITDYGYSINALPTAQNLTWTGSGSTSLPADNYATRQGSNSLYLVAKDDSGAYALNEANYAVVNFICQTPAPPIPTELSITDSSDRILSRYMLTLQWAAGTGQDSNSFDHYSIERSLNGTDFTAIAVSASSAYIDTGLDNSTPYYYRIKAIDNAGKESAASTIVSKTPTGKYATPPEIISEPRVEIKSTTATISWVVSRSSIATIRYGTSKDNLSESQVSSDEGVRHTIQPSELRPNTTYYYQVQALDPSNIREYSSESAYSSIYEFQTEAAPAIANVEISNITLTSADITWETTSASNTKIYYGDTISYGLIIPESDASMTTKHAIKIENLAHSTKYHFKVYGKDIEGNTLTSDDYAFETLKMPVISAIEYQPDFTGPAPVVTISWITNVPTTSSVEYSPRTAAEGVTYEESQSALVTRHLVTLSNLSNQTEYQFTVSGSDQFGNKAASDLQILKTGTDSRAPEISNITVETSNIGSGGTDEAKLIVFWETDELSTSQVAFDEGIDGKDYRQRTAIDPALTKNHIVVISGLKPGTPYYFKVISKDETGNISEGSNQTVITGQVQESIFTIISRTLNSVFGWIGGIVR